MNNNSVQNYINQDFKNRNSYVNKVVKNRKNK